MVATNKKRKVKHRKVQPIQKSAVAYFVARIGGWDGIALQAELWLELLLSMRKRITLVTGEVETSPGPLDVEPFNKVSTRILPDLSLEHQKELYWLSFKRNYNRERWVKKFIKHKRQIKRQFKELIKTVPVVILHNFSIKHLIPSAWAAMYELMSEFKDKKFISLAADSPFERSYLMEKFSKDVLRILGDPKIWYKKNEEKIIARLKNLEKDSGVALPGPDRFKHLKYVVLNTNQKKIFHNIYGISDSDLYAIPDIGKFDAQKVRKKPSKKDFKDFFAYLLRNQLTNPQTQLDKNALYFISPVRPIRRKKLIEIVYLCKLYQEFLSRKQKTNKVVLVVTHPNRDEKPYFKEVVKSAKKFGLTFIFLGDEIKLRKKEKDPIYTYNQVMNFFSFLNSICIVGSEFGGWENGILEATEHKIPVCVNPLLPSFQDMTALGYNYTPTPIMVFSDLVRVKYDPEYLKFPSISTFYKKVHNRFFDAKSRRGNVNHNYKVGIKRQSKDVTKIQLRKMLKDSVQK